MIGIILVGHGRLPSEFKASLNHIVGETLQVEVVDIMAQDDMEAKRDEIMAAVRSVDRGDGVILLTDMFGGTPSNLAMSVLGEDHQVEVIAGVNLPMLVKLVEIRSSHRFADAVTTAQEAGKRYINVAGHLLDGR